MHIIFLVLLELVLGNAILDCQDSKGLLLSDFLSLHQGYTHQYISNINIFLLNWT